MGFTVSVEVTAVNGKGDADGTAPIEALLRMANCPTNSKARLADAQSSGNTMGSANAAGARRKSLN
jgi:hypothetical protein